MPKKVALLVGVSKYGVGLNPLRTPENDVMALQRVLANPEIGSFAVKPLINPDLLTMQTEIETWFTSCQKDDLVLFYFAGHGVKDENGKLYLTTTVTCKTPPGELVKGTAVPASFIHDVMSKCYSRRQVIILDCCFSGAFAEGFLARDDGIVDIKTQFGGEGRVVLTATTSTQYALEGAELSIYTRYLVEGLETGVAAQENQDTISVDELHEYVRAKVQAEAPAMKPEIYAAKEGSKIVLAKAPTGDKTLIYRKEVERWTTSGNISPTGRRILNILLKKISVLPEEARAIEEEVLRPYREYQKNLQEYEEAFSERVQEQYPLNDNTRSELKRLQQLLNLRDEDVVPVEQKIVNQLPDNVRLANKESSAESKNSTTESTSTEKEFSTKKEYFGDDFGEDFRQNFGKSNHEYYDDEHEEDEEEDEDDEDDYDEAEEDEEEDEDDEDDYDEAEEDEEEDEDDEDEASYPYSTTKNNRVTSSSDIFGNFPIYPDVDVTLKPPRKPPSQPTYQHRTNDGNWLEWVGLLSVIVLMLLIFISFIPLLTNVFINVGLRTRCFLYGDEGVVRDLDGKPLKCKDGKLLTR